MNKIRIIVGTLLVVCAGSLSAQTYDEEVIVKSTQDSILSMAVDSASIDTSALNEMELANEAVETALNEAQEILGTTRSLGSRIDRSGIRISDKDTIPLYEEGYGGLAKLDGEIANYKVFITGENHTYTESNARLWLKMIKYLNENAGVRNVMFEYGYSYGFLVNEYLKTGDTSLINSIDQFAYMEYSDVIRELKVYNDSLPEERKLYFDALDIERGAYPIAKSLSYLLPPKSEGASDSIQLHIKSLRSLSEYNDFKLDEMDDDSKVSRGFTFKTNATIQLVQTNFIKFESDYEAYLGDNFEHFKSIIMDRFNARKKWYEYDNSGAIQQYIYREQYMHQQFLKEASQHSGGWFGQFGRCHTSKEEVSNNSCEWFVFNSLADQIEHSAGEEYLGKVMTLAMAYNTDRNFGESYEDSKENLTPFFDDLEENRIGLIKVSSDTSLSKGYGRDFDYLLFNTYEERGESYDYLNDYAEASEGDDADIYIEGGVGVNTIDLKELNTLFDLKNASNSFDGALNYWDLSFGIRTNSVYSTYQGGMYRVQNREVKNTSTGAVLDYKLSGHFWKTLVGFNIFNKVKWINLIPMIGGAYQNVSLELEETAGTVVDLENGFLGELKNTKYVNDAFVLEGACIARLNLGPVSVGAQIGYQWDISNKSWKSGDSHLNNGPSTSFNGLYQSYRIGFNF
jgi:hypothetical protein